MHFLYEMTATDEFYFLQCSMLFHVNQMESLKLAPDFFELTAFLKFCFVPLVIEFENILEAKILQQNLQGTKMIDEIKDISSMAACRLLRRQLI